MSRPLLRKYRSRILCPVIVEAKEGMFSRVRDSLRELIPVELLQPKIHRLVPATIEYPFSKYKEIEAFNMVSCILTPNLIEDLAEWGSIEKIYYDDLRWALQTVPPEGVYLDWRKRPSTTSFWIKKTLSIDKANRKGYTGRNVRVAVLDTGLRITHPQIIERAIRPLTAVPEKGGSGIDECGHGTHVATILGGMYRVDPRYKVPVEGMAPESIIIPIQVLGFIIGVGTSSDVIKGMEMALRFGAKIINMSLGGTAVKDEDNPEAKAINKIVEAGAIPVAAAGNDGPEAGTINSPGSCLNSLTVGNYDEFEGKVHDSSSRGPTPDGYIKPDVVAPGVRVNSGLVGYIDAITDPSQPKYGALTGTSMSTPAVSGLLACAAQLYIEKLGMELTVEEVKKMMEELGPNQPKDNDQGHGLITWDIVERWVETSYGFKV